jgi:hypothetical protein
MAAIEIRGHAGERQQDGDDPKASKLPKLALSLVECRFLGAQGYAIKSEEQNFQMRSEEVAEAAREKPSTQKC